jgi:hypothetical protein
MTQQMKKDFLISQGWHTLWNDDNWVFGSDYTDMSGHSLDEAYKIAITCYKIKV